MKKSRKQHPIEKIRISPQLKWVEKYLRRAIDKMPNLELPRQLRTFKPLKNKMMRTYGNVYFETKTISIATYDQLLQKQKSGRYRVYRIVKLSKQRILETLAHELSHLHYPEHGFEQDEFTKVIFKAFELKETCPHCEGTGQVLAPCRS